MNPMLMALSLAAFAAEEEGIPVTVRVIDAETQAPIATAVVRHPDEADPHRVNAETGQWTGNVLYMPDGSEKFFEKGLEIALEISAPGYANRKVSYIVRKRKNVVEVPLTKMTIDMSDEDPEEVMIQFGRDKPID